LFAAAALLGGCGSAGNDSTASDSGATEVTDLRIALDPDGPGEKQERSKTVECGPEAEQEFSGCDLLTTLPPDFGKPTPAQTPCTELYGGPDVVEINGTLDGVQLEAKLTRADGCEVARFDPIVPVLEKLFPGYEPGSAIGA
jgi:hypothetical protein